MTNAEIILEQSIRLMEQGILKGTGEKLTYTVTNAEGVEEVREAELPEEIHTFAAWKQKGFSVKKGEHAVASFLIWKYSDKKVGEVDGEEVEDGRMFLKKSHFFTRAQVEPIAN